VTEGCTEIAAAGTPHERGRAIGRATAVAVHRFLGEGVARLAWIAGAPVDRARLEPAIDRHAEVVERHLPEIAATVHGFAEGAEIARVDAWLLQLRRELLPLAAADCTTIVGPPRSGSASPLAAGGWIAQTVDLAGDLADHALVLRERGPGGEVVQLAFTGLLGYLGMNDRGLAVGINMVMSGDWRPGIPPYLVVRHLLGLGSVAECLDELPRLPRASSRCYALVDRREAAIVETTCERVAVLRGEPLVHTNHYLDPELAALDRSHVVHRRESRRRRERALAALGAATPIAAAGEPLFDLLSLHGDSAICFHGDGDPRRAATVAAAVLAPTAGRMFVRRGPPCRGKTTVHGMEVARA
jgi:isopenicillin-N N-acyltransferase-like protein